MLVGACPSLGLSHPAQTLRAHLNAGACVSGTLPARTPLRVQDVAPYGALRGAESHLFFPLSFPALQSLSFPLLPFPCVPFSSSFSPSHSCPAFPFFPFPPPPFGSSHDGAAGRRWQPAGGRGRRRHLQLVADRAPRSLPPHPLPTPSPSSWDHFERYMSTDELSKLRTGELSKLGA